MPENFTQVAGKKTEVLEHLTISDGFLLFCHNTYRWRAGCVPTQATFKCGLTFSCAMRLRWLYLTTSLGFRRPCGASSLCCSPHVPPKTELKKNWKNNSSLSAFWIVSSLDMLVVWANRRLFFIPPTRRVNTGKVKNPLVRVYSFN